MSTAKTGPGYSRSHRAVEITSITLVLAMLVMMAIRVSKGIESTGDWIYLGFTALTGYLTADFLSGVVHWAGDTLGDETTPVIGKNFVMPFRQHHVDPKEIATHDFIETNGNNCIVVLAPLGIAYLVMPSESGFWFFSSTLMGFLALFIVATNQFHKWAHSDHPPRVAVLLQRGGLILSPEHHNVHHAKPHDRQYCITVGWMNPLLNRIQFFRGVEAVVAAVRPEWLYLEERELYVANATEAAGQSRPV